MKFSQGFAVLGGMGWWGSGNGGSVRGQSLARLVFGGGLMVCHCLAGALRVDLLRHTPCCTPKLTADYRWPEHASRVCTYYMLDISEI